MICYLTDVEEEEIAVINDYWLLADDESNGFLYTLKQIDDRHKSTNVSSVSILYKKSSFHVSHIAFVCQECNCKIPVKNRTEYLRQVKRKDAVTCAKCLEIKRQRLYDEAGRILKEYKARVFQSEPYLDELTIEETLGLLSISAEQAEGSQFLGESFEEITITGVQSIDQKILQSLVDKKALVYIPEIPSEVAKASALLYGDYDHISYDTQYYRVHSHYRSPDSVVAGVYMMPLALGEYKEISDITPIIYQKLQSSSLSVDDVIKVREIIKEIQIGKLYQLTEGISREYAIPIANTNVLRVLLNHLTENYPPQNIYFTFRMKAKDAVVHMHKERAPEYIAKHYFAKFVGSYIQYVENNDFELKKTWSIPPHIEKSPFEALFSQLYLNGHFDWNKLSAKEVVALWLENVRLSEEAQELLFESNAGNSMYN